MIIHTDSRRCRIDCRQIIFSVGIILCNNGTIRIIGNFGYVIQQIVSVFRSIQTRTVFKRSLTDKSSRAVIIVIIEQRICDVNVFLRFSGRSVFPSIYGLAVIALGYKLSRCIVIITRSKPVAVSYTLQRTVIFAISISAQQIFTGANLRAVSESIIAKCILESVMIDCRKKIGIVIIRITDRCAAARYAGQPIITVVLITGQNTVAICNGFQ